MRTIEEKERDNWFFRQRDHLSTHRYKDVEIQAVFVLRNSRLIFESETRLCLRTLDSPVGDEFTVPSDHWLRILRRERGDKRKRQVDDARRETKKKLITRNRFPRSGAAAYGMPMKELTILPSPIDMVVPTTSP